MTTSNVLKVKQAAYKYFNQGLNVIPIRLLWKNDTLEKQPLCKWKKWMQQRQTQDDFEKLFSTNANGFAVIGGSLTKGKYLAAVDLDVKGLPKATIEHGKQVISKLPPTQMEKTPSGGIHLLYFCRDKLQTTNQYRKNIAIELLGENKLIIMSPSQGYTKRNEIKPTVIQNLEETLRTAIETIGAKQPEDARSQKVLIDPIFEPKSSWKTPYKGDDPPCIKQLLRGTKEGQRNEVALRLASYYANVRQENPQKVLRKMRGWNKFNDPPLDPKEVESTVKNTVHGGYIYGCKDPILKSNCNPNIFCALRAEEKKEKEEKIQAEFDSKTEQKIKEEVQRIQEADNKLVALEEHLDNIHVGERKNKLALIVLNFSGKVDDPKMKTIVILKGTSGGGKSSLVRATTLGLILRIIGRYTMRAMDYTNYQGIDLLILKELGRIDEEKSGISTIKFLSSDDGGYTTEYTIRDEKTGKMTTATHTIPPLSVISTTIRLLLEPQLTRRAFEITVDDSQEQTKKVLSWKAKNERQEAEKAVGKRTITDYEFSTEAIKRIIETLHPVKVIIPFPETITSIYSSKFIRLRGDISKIYTFIKLYSQFNLKRLRKTRNNVYAVTPEVAIEALNLINDIIITMLVKLEQRTIDVLEALQKIIGYQRVKGKDGKQKIVRQPTTAGTLITKSIRDQIPMVLNKSYYTIHKRFNALEASGYLSSDNAKPKTFKLLYDLDEILEKTQERIR